MGKLKKVTLPPPRNLNLGIARQAHARGGDLAEAARIETSRVDAEHAVSRGPGFDGRPVVEIDVKNTATTQRGRDAPKRNANHCTVCWLHYRKHLTDLQRDAAEMLQGDFSLAGLSSIPSTLAALAAGGGHGGGGAADLACSKIDASKRLAAALRALGTSGRFLVEQIVLYDRAAKHVATILRKHEKSIVPSLCVALDVLIAHYQLETSGAASSRVRTYHPFQQSDEK